MTIIRHLAVSRDSAIVAAAEFEHKVHTWDIKTGCKISEFMTVLDFGGKRLSLSHDGQLCVAASYGDRGITCHSTKNGATIWHRDDLTKFQELSISADGKRIYCDIDSSHCLVLDINNGSTLDKIPQIRIVYDSDIEPKQLLVGSNYLLRNKIDEISHLLKKNGKSMLDVAFGGHRLGISECGGNVYFFDSNNAQKIWHYHSPPGNHVLKLYHSRISNRFYGIERPYEKGGNDNLLDFNIGKKNARIAFEFSSPQPEISFIPYLDKIITSKGLLIDLQGGAIERELEFES